MRVYWVFTAFLWLILFELMFYGPLADVRGLLQRLAEFAVFGSLFVVACLRRGCTKHLSRVCPSYGKPERLSHKMDVLAIQNATKNLSVTLESGASKVGFARVHPVICHSAKGKLKRVGPRLRDHCCGAEGGLKTFFRHAMPRRRCLARYKQFLSAVQAEQTGKTITEATILSKGGRGPENSVISNGCLAGSKLG